MATKKTSFRLSSDYRRLLEVAGTLEQHEKAEHALFKAVCAELKKLEQFCRKQGEPTVYDPIAKEAKKLCDKLHAHCERYVKDTSRIPTHTGPGEKKGKDKK